MILAEMAITALLISLGLFTRQGDVHLQCFQVNPETHEEQSIGYITLKRKKRHLRANLIEWGPEKVNRPGLGYIAVPDQRLPLMISILDSDNGISGHNWLLTRHSTLKKRYALSEGVADPSRLDYCKRIKKRDLPRPAHDAVNGSGPAASPPDAAPPVPTP